VVPEPVHEVTTGPIAPTSPIVEWLDTLSVFIPKSIREPALGDLLEDLGRMRARGSSTAAMGWAVIVQLVALALRGLVPKWFRG